jgi:autotransporter-associated beta strand protein
MYKVLGVMSGSSLDGLDLCISSFSQENGLWSSEILKTAAVVFPENLVAKLTNARNLTGLELTILENEFSGFVADSINTHFNNNDYELIGFHGHTIFHNPYEGYTLQIGNGGTSGALRSGGLTNNGSLILNRSDTFTVSNTISGGGGLIQAGTGTVILTRNNFYTGGTTVLAGTLSGTMPLSFGATSSIITLGNTTGSTNASVLIGTNGALTINYAIVLASGTTGTLTLGSNSTSTNTSNATLFSGGVTGSNNLTINNNGTNILRF